MPGARPETVEGASVVWSEGAPPAGTLVKARLRGASRERLFSQSSRWQLKAGDRQLKARLHLPESPIEPQKVELAIIEHSPVTESEIVVVLDRGEDSVPVNRLELELAASMLQCEAFVELSMDNVEYQPPRDRQVLYQEIRDGAVLRITTLKCDAGNRRYIRIKLLDTGGASINWVHGWLEDETNPPAYKVEAALGSMRELPQTGQHLWPLILETDRLPLLKLKVTANTPGEIRLIDVVRLASDQTVRFSETQAVWANKLTVGNLERDQKWIDLPRSISGAPWGLIIHDGERPPLQLEAVQIYAAEAWVEFVRPETGPVQLWFEPGTDESLINADFGDGTAVFAGFLDQIDLEIPVIAPASGSRRWAVSGEVAAELRVWWKAAAYALGALIAFIIGAEMLRRRSRAETSG